MTADIRRLQERRDQALRDLADIEAQVAGGELTAAEAAPLRLRYERAAADAITALGVRSTPADGQAAPPEPAEPAEQAGSTTAGATVRRPRTRLLYSLAAATAVVAAAVALPASVGDRPAGGFVTGNEVRGSAPAPPPPSGGRDLSTVTDAEMERVIAENPDVLGMRVALADRYADKGRYDQAVTHYLAVLKRDPGSAAAQAGLAWAMFRTGRPEQALPLVDRALRSEPSLPRALWTKANILLYAGADPSGAIDLLRTMERQPLTPTVRKQVTDLIAVAEARRPGG